MTRDFRFGIGLRSIRSADRLREKVRKFEGLGFDVLHFPDHIGAPAPFPAMVAAANAASSIRVGTFVINAAFYSPALLARALRQAGRELLESRGAAHGCSCATPCRP